MAQFRELAPALKNEQLLQGIGRVVDGIQAGENAGRRGVSAKFPQKGVSFYEADYGNGDSVKLTVDLPVGFYSLEWVTGDTRHALVIDGGHSRQDSLSYIRDNLRTKTYEQHETQRGLPFDRAMLRLPGAEH